MFFNIITKVLLKGLGPLNGWKTIAGVVLGVVNLAAQYMDVVPAAIPTQFGDIIASAMIGLGLGDKMGKERAVTPKKK